MLNMYREDLRDKAQILLRVVGLSSVTAALSVHAGPLQARLAQMVQDLDGVPGAGAPPPGLMHPGLPAPGAYGLQPGAPPLPLGFYPPPPPLLPRQHSYAPEMPYNPPPPQHAYAPPAPMLQHPQQPPAPRPGGPFFPPAPQRSGVFTPPPVAPMFPPASPAPAPAASEPNLSSILSAALASVAAAGGATDAGNIPDMATRIYTAFLPPFDAALIPPVLRDASGRLSLEKVQVSLRNIFDGEEQEAQEAAMEAPAVGADPPQAPRPEATIAGAFASEMEGLLAAVRAQPAGGGGGGGGGQPPAAPNPNDGNAPLQEVLARLREHATGQGPVTGQPPAQGSPPAPDGANGDGSPA
jgi:hypothetical protein